MQASSSFVSLKLCQQMQMIMSQIETNGGFNFMLFHPILFVPVDVEHHDDQRDDVTHHPLDDVTANWQMHPTRRARAAVMFESIIPPRIPLPTLLEQLRLRAQNPWQPPPPPGPPPPLRREIRH